VINIRTLEQAETVLYKITNDLNMKHNYNSLEVILIWNAYDECMETVKAIINKNGSITDKQIAITAREIKKVHDTRDEKQKEFFEKL